MVDGKFITPSAPRRKPTNIVGRHSIRRRSELDASATAEISYISDSQSTIIMLSCIETVAKGIRPMLKIMKWVLIGLIGSIAAAVLAVIVAFVIT